MDDNLQQESQTRYIGSKSPRFHTLHRIEAIMCFILPGAHPKARLAGAIGTLCSYSSLEKRGDGMKLDMHRLSHLATRRWISQDGRNAETNRAALKHVFEVFPSDNYASREIWRDYLRTWLV